MKTRSSKSKRGREKEADSNNGSLRALRSTTKLKAAADKPRPEKGKRTPVEAVKGKTRKEDNEVKEKRTSRQKQKFSSAIKEVTKKMKAMKFETTIRNLELRSRLRSSMKPLESKDISPHPLLIPGVIGEVFKMLGYSELRKCRLVCRDWGDETLRLLSSKAVISLAAFADIGDFIHAYEGSRSKFSRFKLGPNVNLQDTMIQRFFNKFGSSITYLHFDWTHWIPASLRKILFEKLPALEELIICSQRMCENVRFLSTLARSGADQKLLKNIKILRIEAEHDGIMSQFILDLVSVMPNLRVVTAFDSTKAASVCTAPKLSKIGQLRYEQWDNYTDLTLEDNDPNLLITKELVLNPGVSQLKYLEHMKIIFDIQTVNRLKNADYLIKSLEVVVPGQSFLSWHPRPNVLHNFILSLSKTLTALKLNYCSGRPKILTSFDGLGRLKNLTHLHLHRVCGTLDFLQALPSLKSLFMTQEDFIEHYDEFHAEENRPHKLQSLKLYYTNWSASSVYNELPRSAKILNVVENIVQRFPQLSSLRMENLTDKALVVIYSHLPLLEELEATNGVFTSVGICGIPVMNQASWIFRRRQCAYIGSLQNLKKLRLESNKLTDYGIQSSIPGLRQLEELTLLCYKITDESLGVLARRLKNLKVFKTEFCYELTEAAIGRVTAIMKERGTKVLINPFCGSMEIEKIHDFLNDNGPIHVSIPDFP